MKNSTRSKGTALLAATLTLGLAPALVPAQAQAAGATGVKFNNLSITSALNSDPTSDAQADDSQVVKNGDRLYLGSSSNPNKLTGWLVESDGSRKAFTPDDYTVSAAGDHAYKLSFKGTSLTVNVSQSANVATMYMRTHDGKNLPYVEQTKGNVDQNGSMALVNADGSLAYNGTLKELKGRGNYTWGYAKKPYQIKLDKSTELVPGAGKSKTWILLANYVDPTSLRNEISYNMEGAVLQRAGARDDSIKGRLTDLYIDGDYRGTYYLCEKVQVDKSRIDITDTDKGNEDANPGVDLPTRPTHKVLDDPKFPGIQEAQYIDGINSAADYANGGYLLEMDFAGRARGERSYFITRHGTPFALHTPEDASADEMGYISGVFQDFEDALFAANGKNAKGKSWQDYVDVDSFARFYALQEFFANQDAFQSSTYFYLDKGGKIVASPVWDDDRGLGGTTSSGPVNKIFVAKASRAQPQWIKQLQSKTEFRNAVASAYNNQLSPVIGELLSSGLSDYAAEAKYTTVMNRLRWGAPQGTGSYYESTPEGDIDRLRSHVVNRNAAMKSQLTSSGYLKSAALPNGTYTIANGKLVADVAGASTADGANAQLYPSNGSDAQRFRVTRGDDGHYTIVNVKSGKALEVARASSSQGANVQQYTANGSKAQKWLINSYDGVNYTIVTALTFPSIAGGTPTGRVLTATNNGTTAGTNLEVRQDGETSGQTFTFSTTSGPTTPPTGPTDPGTGPQVGKTYTISTALDRKKVLDVKGASTANGANIQTYTANGSKAQNFTLAAGANGTYVFKTGLGGVMDLARAGMTPGTNVWQYAANGSSAQTWILKPTGANDGSYFIVSAKNGLNLDVDRSSTANGTNVQTYTANGGNGQKFYLNLK